MPDSEKFSKAADELAKLHAADPRGEASTYHDTVASWVERLEPTASEALRLAARCQHLLRFQTPRESYPQGVVGYKRWRTDLMRKQAAAAAELLRSAGYDDAMASRVSDLVMKKGLATDREAQVLEDAVCLTFLELELERFAAKHGDDKVIDILKKTWRKMTPAGHEAALKLARGLPLRLTTLLAAATD